METAHHRQAANARPEHRFNRPVARRRLHKPRSDRDVFVNDFLTALGLLLVFEGVLYGGFPRLVKGLAEQLQSMPENALRVGGLLAAASGVILVWLVRG